MSSTGDSRTVLRRAFETRDIEEFLALIFPEAWGSVASRILESGAQMSPEPCAWAPRWSLVPPTTRPRRAKADVELWLKSCIFRAHDCLHQLWGLPRPDEDLSEESFRVFKKAQMCGEVATLTLTEFELCRHLATRFPDLAPTIGARNALPLLEGPMALCNTAQIAARLDGLLHKKIRPDWVRSNPHAVAFCDDYVPMLERDRTEIDHNWRVMRQTGWRPPADLPNARYDARLDGQELTLWMVEDFDHLKRTGRGTDQALVRFNRERRAGIVLPPGWGAL